MLFFTRLFTLIPFSFLHHNFLPLYSLTFLYFNNYLFFLLILFFKFASLWAGLFFKFITRRNITRDKTRRIRLYTYRLILEKGVNLLLIVRTVNLAFYLIWFLYSIRFLNFNLVTDFKVFSATRSSFLKFILSELFFEIFN